MGNCGSTNKNKVTTTTTKTTEVKKQDDKNKTKSNEVKTNANVNKPEVKTEEPKKEENKAEVKAEVKTEVQGEIKKEEVKAEQVKDAANEEEVVITGQQNKELLAKTHVTIQEKVCSFNNFAKKAGKKFDNFTNAFVDEINYSALRVTKYYRDQSPYTGEDPYVDPFFPPNNNSIFGLDADGIPIDKIEERRLEAENDFQIDKDNIVWLRPEEVFGPEFALFEGNIEFDDVRQGSIGNCYFMASISALTENPQCIAEIFRVLSVQKNGYYEVCLKLDGVWNVVCLDDYIPCRKNDKKPIFATPKGNELWAILLEKAWAKVNGGYINTVAGMASEVIECLTNFPYEYNNTGFKNSNDENALEQKEELWAKILQASSNDYIMTTALPPNDEAKDIGLVVGHEYTLEEGKEANINGNNYRLVKIRNPWGTMKYTGEWSENCPNWTDELKKEFDYQSTYDGQGEFFMSYDQFIQFFADVDICKIENRVCMKQYTIPYEKSFTPSCFELLIFDKAKVDMTFFKPYYRFERSLPSDWTVTQTIFIARCDDKENLVFSCFNGTSEGQNDCTLLCELDPGLYYIYVFCNYSSAKDIKGTPIDESVLSKLSNTFSLYCTEFFGLTPVEESNTALLYRMIISYAKSQEIQSANNINYYSGNNICGSEYYFLYIKSSLDKAVKFTAPFSNTGLNPLTVNEESAQFNLHPEQEVVLLFYCHDLYEPHGMNFSFKYKKSKTDDLERNDLIPYMDRIQTKDPHSRNIKNYQWIYKKGDVDYKNILQKIDVSDAAFKFFKHQYPKLVEDVENVPKLADHDTLNLQVQDKVDFGDGDWYFGEWMTIDGELNMHGRGQAVLSGNTFVGQFQNHSFEGVGTMILPNGDKIQGNFSAFNPKGKVNYTFNDGKTEVREYA